MQLMSEVGVGLLSLCTQNRLDFKAWLHQLCDEGGVTSRDPKGVWV